MSLWTPKLLHCAVQCLVATITIHHTSATDVTNVTNLRPRHLAPAPSYLDWAELGLISIIPPPVGYYEPQSNDLDLF